MNAAFKIIDYGSEEWENAVKLREEILRKPLGSYFTEEELAEEKNHHQVVGFINSELVATAVLVPEGNQMKMQRVVVKNTLQDSGIGSGMMLFCEDFTRKTGKTSIYCHARDTAVKFYLRNSYLTDGDYFPEDGIPHLKMYKII